MSEEKNFIKLICTYIDTNIISEVKTENKKAYIRIHASGDFYDYDYFEKWTRIAEKYRDNPSIQFVAYTKAFNILQEYKDKEKTKPNIRILLSIMPDTFETYVHEDGICNIEKTKILIEELVDFYSANQYIVHTRLLIEKYRNSSTFKQKCFIERTDINCGICTKCYSNDDKIKIFALFRRFNFLSYLKKLEKTNQKLAISLYNSFIKEEYIKIDKNYFQMYKRLQRIYRSKSDIEEEKRVLNIAITVFKKAFEENNDSEKEEEAKKYLKYFENRYNKLQNLK